MAMEVWTEERIRRLQRDGRGRGEGKTYVPWLKVARPGFKLASTFRMFGRLTGREHHLLSPGEASTFWMLERSPYVLDIREQFPLDRGISIGVAQAARLPHKPYPGTQVPIVMTIDFMVTMRGPCRYRAFSVKAGPELSDPDVLIGLELERRICDAMNVPYHLVVHHDIDKRLLRNIRLLQGAARDIRRRRSALERREQMADRLESALRSSEQHSTLAEFCLDFDTEHGLRHGYALMTAKWLMWQRRVQFDLSTRELSQLSIADLIVVERSDADAKLAA